MILEVDCSVPVRDGCFMADALLPARRRMGHADAARALLNLRADLPTFVDRERTAPKKPCDPPAVADASTAQRGQAQLERWLQGIVLHDEQALAALRDATSARVRAVVARIVTRHQHADEIVADCFWQVWRDAVRYEPTRGSVLAWILTIARSRAIDTLRRNAAEARHEVPFDENGVDEIADSARGHGEGVETRHRDAQLRALLESLSPLQRQLVAMAFFLDLSHQEISVHARLPLGTVKSHIRRALTQLNFRCIQAGLRPET